MTNREWLATLTDEELARWMCEDSSIVIKWVKRKTPQGTMMTARYDKLYPRRKEVSGLYTSSIKGIEQWLGEDRKLL